METLTEPITTERLLIFENTQQIALITSEVQARQALLNKILGYGIIENEDISKVTSSTTAIDDFIFSEQLKVNKELKKQHDAGKKNLKNEYNLPANLEGLKNALTSWCNYRMSNHTANKFQFLIFDGGQWKADAEKLERYFVMHNVRFYVEGEQLKKWRKAEQFIDLLNYFDIPWNHLVQSSAFTKLLDINGLRTIPRWQYFQDR